MIKHAIAFTSIAAGSLALSSPAAASSDPFIGQVQAFGFNFCPRGWAKADGRLMQISEYSALFSLLGTLYGGDGRTTFALPDLIGRSPMGAAPPREEQRRSRFRPSDRVGEKRGGVGATQGEDLENAKQLAVTYCIALQGTYPSRN